VKKPSAFTLVEMLVVIAIIGVLAGMILPALSSARENARRTNCLNNLGQIGKCLGIYLANFSDYYPSYANYGSDTPAVLPGIEYGAVRRVYEYQAAADYDRLSSRHMVIAYASGNDASYYAEDQRNFIANGLGIMLKQDQMQDASILYCPTMGGDVDTYYGNTNAGTTLNAYRHYGARVFRAMGTRNHMRAIEYGDGTSFTTRGATEKAVAVLSSFSYRLTPFYGATGAAPWTRDNPTSPYYVSLATKPVTKAFYMCPPFKTQRELGLRALASDSFDFGTGATWTKRAMARAHHRDGYNVLFGDAHAKWYFDGDAVIEGWASSTYPMTSPFKDLTISSPTANEVWHRFDVTNDVDK